MEYSKNFVRSRIFSIDDKISVPKDLPWWRWKYGDDHKLLKGHWAPGTRHPAAGGFSGEFLHKKQ